MIKGPKLTKDQWEMIAKALSTMGQTIMLFSLGAFFVPESVLLEKAFPKLFALGFFFGGLTILIAGVILIKKAKII